MPQLPHCQPLGDGCFNPHGVSEWHSPPALPRVNLRPRQGARWLFRSRGLPFWYFLRRWLFQDWAMHLILQNAHQKIFSIGPAVPRNSRKLLTMRLDAQPRADGNPRANPDAGAVGGAVLHASWRRVNCSTLVLPRGFYQDHHRYSRLWCTSAHTPLPASQACRPNANPYPGSLVT